MGTHGGKGGPARGEAAGEVPVAAGRARSPRLPPRWFIRSAWVVHRALYRVTGGRALRRPTATRWGMLRLHTVGRRSGAERWAIVAYLEHGPDLILMAMNGWAEPDPAWFLNLRAHPDVTVDLPGGVSREVTAHVATGEEHRRLWAMWAGVEPVIDGYSTRRTETPLIVLEPRQAA